jgi:hypothetical protein
MMKGAPRLQHGPSGRPGREGRIYGAWAPDRDAARIGSFPATASVARRSVWSVTAA